MSDTSKDIKEWQFKLIKISQTKENIKEAIINKGVSVSDSDTFRSYAEKILQIDSTIVTGPITFIDEFNPSNIDDGRLTLKNLIKRADLTSFNLYDEVTGEYYQKKIDFENYPNLEYLDISTWNTSNIYDQYNGNSGITIANNPHLTTIKWPNNFASNSNIDLLRITDEITHECCLELFNALATRTNSPELELHPYVLRDMSSTEKAIATDKGWTLTMHNN